MRSLGKRASGVWDSDDGRSSAFPEVHAKGRGARPTEAAPATIGYRGAQRAAPGRVLILSPSHAGEPCVTHVIYRPRVGSDRVLRSSSEPCGAGPSVGEAKERDVGQRGRVVVTGASGGVGRAIAEEFGRRGWRVGLIARGAAGLEGARAAVERRGGSALVLPADVADSGAVERAAEEAARAWGGIDVWINAAMATLLAPITDTTPEEFKRVTEVTYLGQVHGTLSALRRMSRQGHGTIVSIGSALAYRGIPLQAAYCAAKFATRGFLDSLRTELIHDRSPVRVTAVHLPAVNTPQFDWARNKTEGRPRPVPPIFQPEAIAREVFRAAMEAPREVWLGFPAVKAIIGDAVAPAYADRTLASQGYSSQLSDAPALDRRDNLFEPVDDERDFGARGRFSSRASDRVHAFHPARLRAGAAAAGALAAAGVALLLARSGNARR